MKTRSVLQNSLAVLAGILTIASTHAQSDDFSDGNDNGWTHYAPLDAVGAVATYTLNNGTYRITSPPSPVQQAGPARAGAVRADVKYRTFFVSVDIKDWDPGDDTSMGILARLQPAVGLGQTSGYAFTYQGGDTDVQISRVDGEVPTDLSGHPSLDLIPGGNYRMVFFGVGSHLKGRIYDMNNPVEPLITVVGNDLTYAEGNCGLVVFADENTKASAAFDNYLATDGSTDPPLMRRGAESPFEISWLPESGLAHRLEYSFDLLMWTPVIPQSFVGGRLTFFQDRDPLESPEVFYRLRLGPQVGIAVE